MRVIKCSNEHPARVIAVLPGALRFGSRPPRPKRGNEALFHCKSLRVLYHISFLKRDALLHSEIAAPRSSAHWDAWRRVRDFPVVMSDENGQRISGSPQANPKCSDVPGCLLPSFPGSLSGGARRTPGWAQPACVAWAREINRLAGGNTPKSRTVPRRDLGAPGFPGWRVGNLGRGNWTRGSLRPPGLHRVPPPETPASVAMRRNRAPRKTGVDPQKSGSGSESSIGKNPDRGTFFLSRAGPGPPGTPDATTMDAPFSSLREEPRR